MRHAHWFTLWLALAMTAGRAAFAADELYFTAPPRDVAGGDESEVYQPVADYLGAAIGRKIVYLNPDNWLSYQSKMRKGEFDLIFDGPHFVSWRIARLQHEPLARLPGKLIFVVIARKDNDRVNSPKDLEGRTVCGMPAPNLATLTMYSLFENPARQPLVIQTRSFKEAYDQMLAGRCVAAAMGRGFYTNFDKDQVKTKVLYTSAGVPNQAFSAGTRFSAQDKAGMTAALLAPEARVKMAKFFEIFNKDKDLATTSRNEFDGVAVLLKDTYGFDLAGEWRSTTAGAR